MTVVDVVPAIIVAAVNAVGFLDYMNVKELQGNDLVMKKSGKMNLEIDLIFGQN